MMDSGRRGHDEMRRLGGEEGTRLMRVWSPKEWRRNAPTIWSFPRIVGRYHSSGNLGFTAIPSCPSLLLQAWEPAVSKVVFIMVKSTMEGGDGLDCSIFLTLHTSYTLPVIVQVAPTRANCMDLSAISSQSGTYSALNVRCLPPTVRSCWHWPIDVTGARKVEMPRPHL